MTVVPSSLPHRVGYLGTKTTLESFLYHQWATWPKVVAEKDGKGVNERVIVAGGIWRRVRQLH